MLEKQIRDWVGQNRERLLELNRTLVSVPSVNRYPYGDEADVQRVVRGLLDRLGCETEQFIPTDVPGLAEHPAYLGGRDYTNRPNVVGRKRGTGGGKSLLFSGHVDTVPYDAEDWTVDPFGGQVKDGRQYGLGIFDMKSGMAAAIAALQTLTELNVELSGDVLIETVVDEEFGGANGTLACRLKEIDADIAIIPEPTNMAVCPQTQGGGMYRFVFSGRAGRSFSGETLVNPAFAAGRFLDIFRRYQEYHAGKVAPSPYFAGQQLPAYLQGMKAGNVTLPLFDRVPRQCSVDVWIQVFPGTTEDELYLDLVRFYEQHAREDELLRDFPVTIEKLIRFLPGSGIPEGHAILPVIREATERALPEQSPVQGAPFACDAFMFNLYSDTPALVWGPKGGNAHAADEFIEVDDYLKLVECYALTIAEWCK